MTNSRNEIDYLVEKKSNAFRTKSKGHIKKKNEQDDFQKQEKMSDIKEQADRCDYECTT